MQHPSFDPHETFDPAAATAEPDVNDTAAGEFFDSAGLLWIVACLVIAFAAGHWIPRLSEPGAWGAAIQPGSRGVLALAGAPQSPKTALPATAPADKGAANRSLGKIQAGMF